MEGLVNQIIAFSANPDDHGTLLNTLKNAEGLLGQNQQHAQAALQALDPAVHSLGTLYILHAIGKGALTAAGDVSAYLDNTSRFLSVCSAPQIQLAPEMFCAVCKKFRDKAIDAGNPRRGILPLKAALRALQPRPEVLTPIHADLFQLCLLSHCYNAAADVVSEDIFDVAPQQTTCTPTDLFLYCYYGGMVCIGRKQYGRALELLLQAVTAPALAGNAIVVAAYKKYVLVCLLHLGAVPPLPKFTSSRVRQILDLEARPYTDLATAYSSRQPERLRRVAEQHAQAFTADTNFGLVKQVLSSLTVRSIQRLTQTFLTLSLADIAANAGLGGPGEAEARILQMVAAGQITAKIDGRTGMVRFADDVGAASGQQQQHGAGGAGLEGWSSVAGVEALDARMRQVLDLSKRLQQANEMVSTDRAYLSKVAAKERSRYDLGGGGGAGPSGPGLGGEDFAPFMGASGGSGSQQG